MKSDEELKEIEVINKRVLEFLKVTNQAVSINDRGYKNTISVMAICKNSQSLIHDIRVLQRALEMLMRDATINNSDALKSLNAKVMEDYIKQAEEELNAR